MRYMGSKKPVLKELCPPIAEYLADGRTYVEPFMGGCNMLIGIVQHTKGQVIAADKNPALVAMWTEAVKGWSPPEMISKPEYEKMRTAWRSKDFSEYPLHLLGFAGYGASYRGSWMASYEGGLCIGSTSRAVTKESKLVSKVEFICSDYTGLEIPPDSVIYCDPPYVESLGHHAFGFNTEEFWAWAKARADEGHVVFVSERKAPPDPRIELIVEATRSNNFAVGVKHRRGRVVQRLLIERLYRVK